MIELNKALIEIGGFCSRTQDLTPTKSISPDAIRIKSILKDMICFFKDNLPNGVVKNLDFFYSKGAIFYPKVPWLSITAKGNLPKKNLSTTICFARNGEGIVCGVLLPSMRVLDFETVQRTNRAKFINVNGTNTPTKYNNNFINPIDIYFSNFSESLLLSHITESIELMKKLEDNS